MTREDLPRRPGEVGPDDVGKKGGGPVENPDIETPTDTPKPGKEVKIPTA